jgi:hypothetical protein
MWAAAAGWTCVSSKGLPADVVGLTGGLGEQKQTGYSGVWQLNASLHHSQRLSWHCARKQAGLHKIVSSWDKLFHNNASKPFAPGRPE